MFLFKVEDRFMLTGIGLVLTPGLGDKSVFTGERIRIISLVQTIISTSIKGIMWNEFRHISVGNNLSKEDVPVGSEVWLNNEL
jgi:hypothetical protein